MNKDQLIKDLYSGDKEKVNEAVKEIKKCSWSDDRNEMKDIFKTILERYNKEDNENIKLTIRGLNASLHIGIPIEYLKKYKNILLSGIKSKDGGIRRTVNSVMDGYRSIFITGVVGILSIPKKQIYSQEELEKFNQLNASSYVELTKLYEKEEDEKVRSSIMAAFKKFHSMAFYNLISKTEYKKVYDKYAQPQLPPMSFDSVLSEFVPLSKLLKEDTEAIKNLKSLYMKEEEYSDFLGETEDAIAEYFYYNNENIKDKDVIRILKNIKENYLKDLDFFKHELEIEIMDVLSELLQEQPITHHELNLILDYLLWAIDNRTWMKDEQAYVKWIAFSHDLYGDKERKKYENDIEALGKQLGMPQNAIDTVLLRNQDFEIGKEQEDLSKEESEFFSMSKDEKINFLMEKGTYFPNLINDLFMGFAEKNDYESIDEFYNKFIETYPDFVPIYIFMAMAQAKKNPLMAKHYLKTGLNELKRIPDMPEEMMKKMKIELGNIMKLLENA